MRTFHANWAYVVIGGNLLVGLWGLFLVWRSRGAPKAFWPAIFAGQGALALQVGIGLAMTRTYGNPSGLHLFYGFVVAIAAVLAYAFRGEGARRTMTVFSAVAVFVGAVSVRAIITAS